MPALANSSTKDKVQELITLSFRDLILCLGGIFIIHQLDDDLVGVITMGVEQIYEETLQNLDKLKLKQNGKKAPMDNSLSLKPHPVIERFLSKLSVNNRKHNKSKKFQM